MSAMKHCTLTLLLLSPFAIQAHTHDHAPVGQIQYVANKGQWPDQVRYRADLPGASMFLEGTAVTWVRLEDGAATRCTISPTSRRQCRMRSI